MEETTVTGDDTLTFTGKMQDDPTGLYYFNARYYDPMLGRFITEDPAKDGGNWYLYCENNPLRYTDPTGKTLHDIIDIGFAAWSCYDFLRHPTWANAGWALWDTLSVLPVVPSSRYFRAGVAVGSKVDNAAHVANSLLKVDYAKYALEATQDSKYKKVVLGKYVEGSSESYERIARKNHATYFNLENWNDISNKIGKENMWNINKEFLDQQWAAGKEFYLSHNPWEATGFFQQELLYLIDLGAKDFVKEGDMWKVIR